MNSKRHLVRTPRFLPVSQVLRLLAMGWFHEVTQDAPAAKYKDLKHMETSEK
jgi:hypothetical protein